MKFASAIALVLATLPFMVSAADAAACAPFCCDAVVPGIRPGGNVGINCAPGGNGCQSGGQVTVCCARLSPNGAQTGTGIGCN
ncbi:hypothetical protein CVT25_014256 [Psilocybe cyanescens]|uniref:Hydrophobin n=1 Tax=Psilocybe cyanescens TaxID=93625 RepID=A0A409VPB9_PSICY|nr:hypothetical protein CVT25_014256 [Psilocybe cyanescens]